MPNSHDPQPAAPLPGLDPRLLEGVRLFNAGEFFDAHEVWEDLWADCPAADRRFVQALIQAAVAVYHFSRTNFAGAARLFGSGRRYMDPYRPRYMGLDIDRFWDTMEAHLAPALTGGAGGPRPAIALAPDPAGDE